MKAALVTPVLTHLPFHPSTFLGYGSSSLSRLFDLTVMDLNAEVHTLMLDRLKQTLRAVDEARVVSDEGHLYPFYQGLEKVIDKVYEAVHWEEYLHVFITTPSWFPTVPTEAVLKLSRFIRARTPETEISFFGNSLGSWTEEGKLKKNGIRVAHLNHLLQQNAIAEPVAYDLLPAPEYPERKKYLFDLLPFMLKHGCRWGRCSFCSLAKGWNSGCLERSADVSAAEVEALADRYDPLMFVCRDNSLNGANLVAFCRRLEKVKKPWGGMCRANLPPREIETLRRAGCRVLYFGLESGSDRMLNAMTKGVTARQISTFIKCLHRNEIKPAPSLIVGAPGETAADFEKTIRFISHHREYFDVVSIYPFVPTPGSEASRRGQRPEKDTFLRLILLIQHCESSELKVCVGEQCAEYVHFAKAHESNGPVIWRRR